MKINSFTNYAFRALTYLACSDQKPVSLHDIANSHAISPNHLKKILQRLTQHGIVHTHRGRNGGYVLAKAAEDIVIGDIFRLTQSDTAFLDCSPNSKQSCVISPSCQLQGLLLEALEAFHRVLDTKTLADLVTGPKAELIALQQIIDTATA